METSTDKSQLLAEGIGRHLHTEGAPRGSERMEPAVLNFLLDTERVARAKLSSSVHRATDALSDAGLG